MFVNLLYYDTLLTIHILSRATHIEYQPHKYGMSWTTHRTGSTEEGGHFYLAEYGIRVQSASNTFVVWQPRMTHGTSLPRISPGVKAPTNFWQTGVSIVTSNRMKKAWTYYLESKGQVVPDDSLLDVEEIFPDDDV